MKNKERTNSQCLLALPPELTAATYVRFLSLLRKGTVSFSASTNLKKKMRYGPMQCLTHIIPALRKLKQEDHKFQETLPPKNKNKQKNWYPITNLN
jgi:hypothetical protein